MKRTGLRIMKTSVMSLAAITAFGVAGCNSAPVPTDDTASTAQTVSLATQQGPARLSVDVDRATAQVAEPIALRLDIRAPQGVAIQFPDSTSSLGQFDVMDVEDRLDIPTGNDRMWTRTYMLESLASGTHQIPAVDVQYIDRREGMKASGVIQSQPVEIQIVSVLEGQADPLAFRDIKGEVELPSLVEADRTWLVYTLGGSAALAIAMLGIVAWQRRRHQQTPAQWALAALAELEQNELPQQGLVEEFYCTLTDIVRGYLERQFAIHAPKYTTDEFLIAMQHEPALDQAHREQLGTFLVVADMVKFARFEPGSSDASETIDVARQFVTATAQHELSKETLAMEEAA
jgi:hypothetical protein